MTFQVIEKTRLPSSSISSRDPPIGASDPGALAKSPAICRAPPLRSCRPIASCTDASFSAVFRYAKSDIRGLAGRTIIPPSFLRFLRPAALLGFAPFAGFIPRMGDSGISAKPGPHVVFAARPPRLIFVGVTDRLVGSKSKGGRPGTLFLAWRSTSGLGSHLRSASGSSR